METKEIIIKKAQANAVPTNNTDKQFTDREIDLTDVDNDEKAVNLADVNLLPEIEQGVLHECILHSTIVKQLEGTATDEQGNAKEWAAEKWQVNFRIVECGVKSEIFTTNFLSFFDGRKIRLNRMLKKLITCVKQNKHKCFLACFDIQSYTYTKKDKEGNLREYEGINYIMKDCDAIDNVSSEIIAKAK